MWRYWGFCNHFQVCSIETGGFTYDRVFNTFLAGLLVLENISCTTNTKKRRKKYLDERFRFQPKEPIRSVIPGSPLSYRCLIPVKNVYAAHKFRLLTLLALRSQHGDKTLGIRLGTVLELAKGLTSTLLIVPCPDFGCLSISKRYASRSYDAVGRRWWH